MIEFFLALIPLLIAYPYFISKIITKNTKTKETNNKEIIKSIIFIILISILSLGILIILLNVYNELIPSSTSKYCTNTGGWTYTCQGDLRISPIILLLMGIALTISHFITQKFVYKIFEYSKGIIKYIYMYIHMIIVYILNFGFFFYLYGIFISIEYDSILVELLRTIVLILPTCLFVISTLVYVNKNKNK